jgi:hypothetical protein
MWTYVMWTRRRAQEQGQDSWAAGAGRFPAASSCELSETQLSVGSLSPQTPDGTSWHALARRGRHPCQLLTLCPPVMVAMLGRTSPPAPLCSAGSRRQRCETTLRWRRCWRQALSSSGRRCRTRVGLSRPASSVLRPASSLQPPASSLQPPASSLQPPASNVRLSPRASSGAAPALRPGRRHRVPARAQRAPRAAQEADAAAHGGGEGARHPQGRGGGPC